MDRQAVAGVGTAEHKVRVHFQAKQPHQSQHRDARGQKGPPVAATMDFTRDICDGQHVEESDAEEPGDVMNTLKNAVNELKRELDYIKGFSIPRAKNSAYKCEGGFQFCLILKRPTNEHYTMLFKKKFKFAESIPEEV